MRDFNGAIGYKNQPMVERYARRNNVTVEEAAHLFEECKRFLVAGAVMKRTFSPSKQLDEMWHHFILHTSDYAKWCEKYVGFFIHHNPTETPDTTNRSTLLQTAKTLFGDIDAGLWPTETIIACSSSCTGDNYCTGDDLRTKSAADCEIAECGGVCASNVQVQPSA